MLAITASRVLRMTICSMVTISIYMNDKTRTICRLTSAIGLVFYQSYVNWCRRLDGEKQAYQRSYTARMKLELQLLI